MHTVIQFQPEDKKSVARFLELPFRLYQQTPQWVPPLDMDARSIFNPKKHPYFRENDAAFFLAMADNNRVAGRLAVLDNRRYNRFNQEHTAFFYLFESENDVEISSALFEAGERWARERGLDKITGPKGFTVFDGLGMLVKGFEHRPAFGLPYNLPYYPALIEAAGYLPHSDLVSGYLDETINFPKKIHTAARLIQERRGLTVTRYRTRGELRELAVILKDMYNASLAGTSGNVPITDEEARLMANQMIWFANPRLVKIIKKDDQPVGFLLAYPDISAAVQKIRGRVFPFGWIHLLIEFRRTRWININGAGMVEGYRGLGGMAVLFSEMFKTVANERYRYADLVQIGVENDRMQRELRDLGIDFYKTHRVYEKVL